jgi:hypothetical protein
MFIKKLSLDNKHAKTYFFRGMLTRYGRYWGNKIPRADKNQQVLPCS